MTLSVRTDVVNYCHLYIHLQLRAYLDGSCACSLWKTVKNNY